MTTLARVCDLCFEEVSVEVAVRKADAGFWTAMPGLTVNACGTYGHAECLLYAGLISIGDRTGPEFLKELNEEHRARKRLAG